MRTVAKRKYPHNVEHVFDVLLDVLSNHYSIINIDKTIRCIEVSSGASLFSFGEKFEVIVVEQKTGSVVRIKTKSRVPWNVTSGVKGKTRKLFDILEENLD